MRAIAIACICIAATLIVGGTIWRIRKGRSIEANLTWATINFMSFGFSVLAMLVLKLN